MELWLIGSGAAAQERDLPAASLARANRVFRFASFDCIGGSVPGREWAGDLEGEALAAGTTARYVQRSHPDHAELSDGRESGGNPAAESGAEIQGYRAGPLRPL